MHRKLKIKKIFYKNTYLLNVQVYFKSFECLVRKDGTSKWMEGIVSQDYKRIRLVNPIELTSKDKTISKCTDTFTININDLNRVKEQIEG